MELKILPNTGSDIREHLDVNQSNLIQHSSENIMIFELENTGAIASRQKSN